jgi:CheY-like chemotaxis protein
MKRVLLVDDDPITLRVYREGLTREGFQVDTAPDGVEALKVLRATRPDVMVLDLMMPKLSGADVLKFMRGQKELAGLPVIVLSNAYMDPLARDAAEFGALRGLLKVKCNPGTLTAAINEVLGGPAIQGSSDLLLAASKGSPARTKPVPELPTAPPAPPAPPAPTQAPSRTNRREADSSRDQARQELLNNGPSIARSLGQLFQDFKTASNQPDRKRFLCDFYRRVHFVTAMAGIAEYHSVAQMASAFEALLFGIMDKESQWEPSLERTTSTAVEFLQDLLTRPPDFRLSLRQNSLALVVDDNRLSNRLVLSALRNAQLQARATEDPETAWQWLQEKHYDLILLDIEMPGMDGIELCKRLRTLPGYDKTPVIFVTLHSDFETQSKTLLSGGTDFIAKPVLPSELAVKVVMHLLKNGNSN